MVVFKLRTPLSAILNAKPSIYLVQAVFICEFKVSIVREWCIRKQILHIERARGRDFTISENL